MANYCIIQPNSIKHNDEYIFTTRQEETDNFFLAAYRHFDIAYPKFHKMDRFCQLGFLTALPIVPAASTYEPQKTGLLLASKSGSYFTDHHYFSRVFAQESITYSPAQFTYTLPSAVLGELSIQHNFQGENYFLLQSQYNFDLLRDYARSLFNDQKLDTCLIGWMDYYDPDQFLSAFLWIERSDLIHLDTIILNINKTCFDYGKATVS